MNRCIEQNLETIRNFINGYHFRHGKYDKLYENFNIDQDKALEYAKESISSFMNYIIGRGGGAFQYYPDDNQKKKLLKTDKIISLMSATSNTNQKRSILYEFFSCGLSKNCLDDDTFIMSLISDMHKEAYENIASDSESLHLELYIHLDLYLSDYKENYLNMIDEVALFFPEEVLGRALVLYYEYGMRNSKNPEFFKRYFSKIKRSDGYQRKRADVVKSCITSMAFDSEFIDTICSKLTKQYQREIAYLIKDEIRFYEFELPRDTVELSSYSDKQLYCKKSHTALRKLAAKFMIGYNNNKEVSDILWRFIGIENVPFVMPIVAKNLDHWDLNNFKKMYKIGEYSENK